MKKNHFLHSLEHLQLRSVLYPAQAMMVIIP